MIYGLYGLFGMAEISWIRYNKHRVKPGGSMGQHNGVAQKLVVIVMGTTWKDIKRVQLLDRGQKQEEQKWDLEFHKRRQELLNQKRESGERKIRNSMKLAEMSARWRSLEQKRVQQNDLYLERLRTNLSLTLRQDTMSAGADSFMSER